MLLNFFWWEISSVLLIFFFLIGKRLKICMNYRVEQIGPDLLVLYLYINWYYILSISLSKGKKVKSTSNEFKPST